MTLSYKYVVFTSLIIALFFFLGFFTIDTAHVWADTRSNTEPQFSVVPQFSPEQTDIQLGYYHLQVKRGEKYPLRVRIFNNNQTSSVYFQVQLRNAGSTAHGQIAYATSQQLKDIPRNYKPLTALSATENKRKVLVPAHSYKDVLLKLKIPTKGFKGTVAGGILVTRLTAQADKIQSESSSSNVTNKFSMTLPVLVSQDFTQKIAPVLSLRKVAIVSSGRQSYLSVALLNRSPVIFGKIHLHIKLSVHKKTIYNKSLKDFQMAPYAVLPLLLKLPMQDKQSKKYSLTIEIHSGKFNKKIVHQWFPITP